MSNWTRVGVASLIAATLLFGGLPTVVWAQQTPSASAASAGSTAAEPSVAVPIDQSGTPAAKDNSISARGVAPTPLQTAGALLGALFAIILAIAGVTLTFRAMRNETRHGRGRSRRNSRPESATLHQT